MGLFIETETPSVVTLLFYYFRVIESQLLFAYYAFYFIIFNIQISIHFLLFIILANIIILFCYFLYLTKILLNNNFLT